MEIKNIPRSKMARLPFILLVCFTLTAMLQIANPAWSNEQGEVFLARGTKFYVEGQFADARDQFLQGTKVDPENAEIWAALGSTNLSLKDYAGAKEALTRAVAIDPKVPRGKLYLGAANYYLNNIPEANRYLKEAKADTPDDGLVRYYLGLVATKQQRPKEALDELETGMKLAPQFALGFKGYTAAAKTVAAVDRNYGVSFTAGVEYDDNVKALPEITSTSTVVVGQQTGQYKGHKADWRTPLILRAFWEPYRDNNTTLGVRYYGYGGLNYYLDNFNICDQQGEVYLKYKWDRLTLSPYFVFDYTWLGGQPYSQFISPGMRFSYQWNDNVSTDLLYMYHNREFKYPVAQQYQRTGYMNQVGAFQTIAGAPGSLRLGFIWEREVTEGINWTNNRFRLPVEGYVLLPWEVTAYGYFEYARADFSNRDSFYGKRQKVDYFQIIFQLRRPITSWCNVVLNYAHTNNDGANLKDYRYHRNIYSLLFTIYY